jgi:hypothetical protein
MTPTETPSQEGPAPRLGLHGIEPTGALRSNRRRFLERCAAAGVAFGLGTLAQLPPARRAFASHVGNNPYEIKSLPCPSYAADHNCSPGCGPSAPSTNYCAPDGHWAGYHRNAGLEWKVRPNECYGGWADGWRWSYGSCGQCSRNITRRCHDGWRCDSNGANCFRTICRYNVVCE